MRLIPRLIPRLHNILGLVVGGQVLLWIVSGFFFTHFPIEQIRGEHLRADVPASIALPEDGLAPLEGLVSAGVTAVRLKPFLAGAAFETETSAGKALFDAATGAALTPLSEGTARQVAETGWAADGALTALALIDPAPRDSGRGHGRAMWRADFDGQDTATF